MFVLTLVLNPFEGISRFGEKAAISPFTLNTVLLEVRFILSHKATIEFLCAKFLDLSTCLLPPSQGSTF
jgi:hypothetical protein